jgi:preprotein translocase subunit YajC
MIYENLLTLAQAAAQSPAPAGGNAGGGLNMLVLPICIGVIFYFLLIRPQSQKQKQQQALISSIKTGDKVVTAGGMHGLVANVKDTTVLVKVADNVKIEVDKSAISVVSKRADDDATPAP